MRNLFFILIVFHGLIHLTGFAKAFDFVTITQISKEISKLMGFFWLIAFLLFLTSALLFFLKNEAWWIIGIVAVLTSQILILTQWNDAKVGTIANIIIVVVILLHYGTYRFEKNYQKDVKENLQRTTMLKTDLLTEADLRHLPQPVQRYLKYSGVVGKPKLKNMRVVFEGQMREKGKDFFPFTCEQYNSFDEPTRLFFMKAQMKGFTVSGYHKYINATAVMDIRLFGIFAVVKKEGVDMDQAETVTVFNDMCLMAPAALIDKRITWQSMNSNSVQATFTNQTITITAILSFNEKGQLVDFISNDRDVNHYPFSTPLRNYKNINGINIMTYGETIWHYPDGQFIYGKFNLKDIQYNVSELK